MIRCQSCSTESPTFNKGCPLLQPLTSPWSGCFNCTLVKTTFKTMTLLQQMWSSVLIEALNWCVCLTGLPTRTKTNRTGANTQKQANGSKNTNNLPLKTKFGYHSVASLRDNLKKVINSTPLTSLLTLTVKYSPNTVKCIYLVQTLPKKGVPVLPRISYSWKVTRWPDPALALLDILGYQ